MESYLDMAGRNHVDLYRLLFEHGVTTLLTPIFGPDLLDRGEDYWQLVVEGLRRFAQHPDFVDFYMANEVQVRFYGEYRDYFAPTPYANLLTFFDEITQRTAHHQRYRLLLGVCAQDNVNPIARLSVEYFQQHGQIPTRDQLIEQYYGLPLKAVDFFIGFDKFNVFDMPLLSTGTEDLYFTVAPSPYLGQPQLREILYDHLYSRRIEETDYSEMSAQDWQLMRDFYTLNRDITLGVGGQQARGNYWYPLPNVKLPPQF